LIYGSPHSDSLGHVYTRIRPRLEEADFKRVQGSGYQRNDSVAVNVWAEMLELRTIKPIGIIQSSLKALQMFVIPFPALMIVLEDMGLGGLYSPNVIGPTPINLVPSGVPFIPMLLPLPMNVVDNAHLGANWAIQV
jgi:virulence-associated protein VapD